MNHPWSYALLTLHKAGSSFSAEILKSIFAESGWLCRDLATEAFDRGLSEFDYIKDNAQALDGTGLLLGPFRGEQITLVPLSDTLHPIIHVRDPRDCLVSCYYSICFSHVMPGPGPERERMQQNREFYRERTIDYFCLEFLTNGDRSIQLLRQAAEQHNGAVVSRYEEMIGSFRTWLDKLTKALPVECSSELLDKLDIEGQFDVVENHLNHKRQVKAGDFRRKLEPRTQRALTEFFEKDLACFGYEG